MCRALGLFLTHKQCVVETGWMSSVDTGHMSAVEKGQMSAAETGQTSAVETRQMTAIVTGLGRLPKRSWLASRRWAQFRQGGGDHYPPETLFLRSLGRTAGGVEKTDHTPRLVTPEGVGGSTRSEHASFAFALP